MNKLPFDQLKKEAIILGALFIGSQIAAKVLFFREGISTTFMVTLQLWWIFLLPGYALLLYLVHKLSFTHRLIMGTALSTGLLGLLSYYGGILGIHVAYHGTLFPILFIISGIVLSLFLPQKN